VPAGADGIRDLMRANTYLLPEQPNECAELLLALSENPSLCFPEAAEAAVAALDFIGTHDKGTEPLDWEPEEPRRPLRSMSISPQWSRSWKQWRWEQPSSRSC
jgi:hypothetical protein